MSVHVFGIRHHGPGCARALRAALAALAPDIILVEGPPDADHALALLNEPELGLVPPVALLIHAVDEPQNAVFYPFAEFSPEWQALRYAAEQKLPARFMDLPCTHGLALEKAAVEGVPAATEPGLQTQAETAEAQGEPSVALREDPLGLLAEAAGFADREQWWDVQVEQRRDATGLFEGILEAMSVLRENHVETDLREQRREAYMRTVLRDAQKQGFSRIAVVCGAWHAPALAKLGPAKADAELLKGLPKIKVAVTWIPWTYARLASRSGYGAGVESPGWYSHVWRYPDQAPVVWATLAARLLRAEDIDASAANVIETVRLAHSLAALRDLPAPGLSELKEAIFAVLCGGEHSRLGLIHTRLEVGEVLGEVPEHAGQAPLLGDFEREVKRLRLKRTNEAQLLELDLRKEADRDRARLFQRLLILGVDWGRLASAGKGSGTFKEAWKIAWKPDFAVDLIAANIFGNTLPVAAAQCLVEKARGYDLAALSRAVEYAIVAHLPAALDPLLERLDQSAAASADLRLQMLALEPLARLVRYSDVRETRAEHVLPVLRALCERVFVGLTSACSQLDDPAAVQMSEALDSAHAACLLLDQAALKAEWLECLHELLEEQQVHPRLRGRACRILLDQQALSAAELLERASFALSRAAEPTHAAHWIEGLVAGEGLALVHQLDLLSVLNGWLKGLSADAFQEQLPLLRRAFSGFQAPERRALAASLKKLDQPERLAAAPGALAAAATFDAAKLSQILPVFAHVLGVKHG